MQYILSEEEYKKGCELIKSFETEVMELDKVYEAQNNLNVQGFFTVICCTDTERDLYKIKVFKRND